MKHHPVLFALFLLASCQSAPLRPETNRPSTGMVEGIALGKTRIVDLTHTLNAQNPYWPGEGNRPFKYEYFTSLAKDGVLEGHFTMDEHTGTHFDAPNHFIAGQTQIHNIPVAQFFVPAVVIDVRANAAQNADYLLTAEDVTQWERTHGQVPVNAVVFMYTGWDTRWDDFAKYKNADKQGVLHFPGFSPEATKLLVEKRDVAGLGIDALSVDRGMSKDFPTHLISHGAGKYNLENVANLGSLPPTGAFLIIAPMKIEGGTGSPVRLFALVATGGR